MVEHLADEGSGVLIVDETGFMEVLCELQHQIIYAAINRPHRPRWYKARALSPSAGDAVGLSLTL